MALLIPRALLEERDGVKVGRVVRVVGGGLREKVLYWCCRCINDVAFI